MNWQSPKLEAGLPTVRRQQQPPQNHTQREQLSTSKHYCFYRAQLFGLPKIIGQKDYRQRLHAFDGRRLDLLESKEIVDHYDSIYASAFVDVLWSPEEQHLEITFTMPFTQQRKAQNTLETLR